MNPPPLILLPDEDAWFCMRARTKTEHLAAMQLRPVEGVDAFCPRVRFLRSTRRGRVWFSEALFPGYFFARFNPCKLLRLVRHSQGVTGLVEFGGVPISVPDSQVEELRKLVGVEEICEVPETLREGDEVDVVTGPLAGLRVVVTQALPARERVRVLLEFLGTLREMEITRQHIASPKRLPSHLKRG